MPLFGVDITLQGKNSLIFSAKNPEDLRDKVFKNRLEIASTTDFIVQPKDYTQLTRSEILGLGVPGNELKLVEQETTEFIEAKPKTPKAPALDNWAEVKKLKAQDKLKGVLI